jgi:hypothetical protein
VLHEHRGFDNSPEPLWLGPSILHRSIASLFSSIRRLFHSYDPKKFLPPITSYFGSKYAICTNSLQHSLRLLFPELAPKRRGRKRKRDTPSESTDLEGYESILLEGVVGRKRDVALLFKWKHLPIEKASWALLSIQSTDLHEWWAEERELRYPLTPPAAFQIQLVYHRNGTIVRG